MEANKRLDDAARAAWLSYIGGKTQDEIAQVLGVSRQSAQRLVSQAMQAGLVKVRIDHPIADCLMLAEELKAACGLAYCTITPALPGSDSAAGVAVALADLLEQTLSQPDPQIVGLGTGRTLRAAVQAMPHLDCRQHKVVSLTGNISADGSTAYYNVLFTISDKVTAPTYPLPMPVLAASPEERETLTGQKTVATTRDLASRATLNIVGIGELDERAPLLLDGFINEADLARLRAAGAIGEITGWAFNAEGKLISGLSNERVTSAPLGLRGADQGVLTVAAAKGDSKIPGILGATRGGLINGLITDEATARAVLAAL